MASQLTEEVTREKKSELDPEFTVATYRNLVEKTDDDFKRRVASRQLEDDEDEDIPFFRRYRKTLLLITVAVAIGIFLVRMGSGSGSGGRRDNQVVAISLPPPPPPPAQPPPPEPKMVEQQQTFQPEEKPEDEPPKPPDQPPLGTNIKGTGENGFGLSGSGNGGLGSGAANRSRFGWYAGQVQSRIAEALRSNRKTRTAEMSVEARIWSDQTGHVTRAQLSGSSGDPSVDAAIKDEVLQGLQLQQPPPEGMPMPIVLRLTARRPR